MIDTIAGFFNIALVYIYEHFSGQNCAVAILILTALVKLITFPLNNQQIQSAKRMQAIQPEMKRLQEKYKNDKQKQNEKVMELMRQEKVNPMAGCLPLLIQFPILIGIFRMLSNPSNGIADIVKFQPYMISAMDQWGLIAHWGEIFILPNFYYFVLPILSGVTTYLYQRTSLTDPKQKMMLYIMPALIAYLSFKFPMGLVLYWVMNNVFQFGQHFVVTRQEETGVVTEPVKGKGKPKERKRRDK